MGLPAGAQEIRSAEVGQLTSAGLGDLKQLINEAEVKRRALTAEVAVNTQLLTRAKGRLRFARAFIVRIFTTRSAPRLAAAVEFATDRLEDSRAQLEGCFVEVDFAFDEATLGSYAALVRTFDDLSGCQRIWDVTATAATDRVAERTMATQALTRTAVSFDFVVPEIVRSQHRAMRMGNAGGRDLFFYPGFVMMRDASRDFALIEYRELRATLSQSRFIEEDHVPSDSEVVGQTWKKANKDGSPDRRFKDNYAIPIARYGELMLRSPTGLMEAYQFSQYGRTEAFAGALADHQRALLALGKAGGLTPTEMSHDDDGDEAEILEDEAQAPAAAPTLPTSFVLDWMALVLILSALTIGGVWADTHRSELVARFASRPVMPSDAGQVGEAVTSGPQSGGPPSSGSQPTAQTVVAPPAVLRRWASLNARCRRGSREESATLEACDDRDTIGLRLNSAGFCHGRAGEAEAAMTWHRCGPGSLHVAEVED
jgi:hypothetical protein